MLDGEGVVGVCLFDDYDAEALPALYPDVAAVGALAQDEEVAGVVEDDPDAALDG